MKVSVDRRLCAGHGLCAAAAPAVFKVNDDWLAEVLLEEPPESMWVAVEKAARYCPVDAIKLASSTPGADTNLQKEPDTDATDH